MMNNTTAGSSSKVRPGSSQPSETSLKRKRGMFQKDRSSAVAGVYKHISTCGHIPHNMLYTSDKFNLEAGIISYHHTLQYLREILSIRWIKPLPETVALAEDIVVEYVTDMASFLVHKAQDVASKRGKLLTEDFLFLIRKDLPKLNRCTELLMNEELKQARKAFEVDEEKLASID
ncbi:UNVERIFIED_CONTAM: Transcription initiation factor TFIID subunit [Sesamum angustifolium]|uniref:Transcription initiation factor TFIID subunit 13 n=1 Tax=Sesamum angustifolium TaxID=2727405 RepID=A0AAW2QUX0_9LAMI